MCGSLFSLLLVTSLFLTFLMKPTYLLAGAAVVLGAVYFLGGKKSSSMAADRRNPASVMYAQRSGSRLNGVYEPTSEETTSNIL